MPTYFVGIEVEAENEEKAKDIAFDKFYFGEWEGLEIQSLSTSMNSLAIQEKANKDE